jgi:hypothetical protein
LNELLVVTVVDTIKKEINIKHSTRIIFILVAAVVFCKVSTTAIITAAAIASRIHAPIRILHMRPNLLRFLEIEII